MDQLLKKIREIPEVSALAEAIESGACPAAAVGLAPVHRAQTAAALARASDRPLVMVCADETEALRLAEDLEKLLGAEALRLFARELFIRAGTVISRQWEHQRVAALYRLGRGECRVLVATAEGLLQKTSPRERLSGAALTLAPGQRCSLEDLPRRLVDAGYARSDQVEGVGQFALRGGILDVFSPLMESPVRCEFFDDEIDSLGAFDPVTQRRTKNIDSALLLPACELLPGAEPSSAFDSLPDRKSVV